MRKLLCAGRTLESNYSLFILFFSLSSHSFPKSIYQSVVVTDNRIIIILCFIFISATLSTMCTTAHDQMSECVCMFREAVALGFVCVAFGNAEIRNEYEWSVHCLLFSIYSDFGQWHTHTHSKCVWFTGLGSFFVRVKWPDQRDKDRRTESCEIILFIENEKISILSDIHASKASGHCVPLFELIFGKLQITNKVWRWCSRSSYFGKITILWPGYAQRLMIFHFILSPRRVCVARMRAPVVTA